jgi:hypothetical protein
MTYLDKRGVRKRGHLCVDDRDMLRIHREHRQVQGPGVKL